MNALSQKAPGVGLHPSTVAEAEVKVTYAVWGLILGAAGAIIVGFNWEAGQPGTLPRKGPKPRS